MTALTPPTPEEVARWEAECAEQGVPAQVADPVTLDKVATLLDQPAESDREAS